MASNVNLSNGLLQDIGTQVNKTTKQSSVKQWVVKPDNGYVQNIQVGIPKRQVLLNIVKQSQDLSMSLDSEAAIKQSFLGLMCACVRYPGRKQLYESVTHDPAYIDWDMVEDKINKHIQPTNLIGNVHMWIHMMDYVEFEHNPAMFTRSGSEMHSLESFCKTLRTHNLTNIVLAVPQHAPGPPRLLQYDHVCKMFLLANLLSLPKKDSIHTYATHILQRLVKQTNRHMMLLLMPYRNSAKSSHTIVIIV